MHLAGVNERFLHNSPIHVSRFSIQNWILFRGNFKSWRQPLMLAVNNHLSFFRKSNKFFGIM
jgi:hypothetical protein